MIPNIARRKPLHRWLKYDGKKHDWVPVKINPENYRMIGSSKELDFYILKNENIHP